jgi:hypothetical protein
VRAKTKPEAERVGKYMIRPVLSMERLTFLETEGKVGYRYGQDSAEQEAMDYLEFIARVPLTSRTKARSPSVITACTPMPIGGKCGKRVFLL